MNTNKEIQQVGESRCYHCIEGKVDINPYGPLCPKHLEIALKAIGDETCADIERDYVNMWADVTDANPFSE